MKLSASRISGITTMRGSSQRFQRHSITSATIAVTVTFIVVSPRNEPAAVSEFRPGVRWRTNHSDTDRSICAMVEPASG